MITSREKAPGREKTYRSTVDMLNGLGADPALVQSVDETLNRTRLVRRLSALRSSRGILQQRIADELGVSQSAVSKIEKGYDEAITLKEIEAYAKVLGFGVEIRFVKPMTLVDRIRYHASQLGTLVHDLAGKAKVDRQIARSVVEAVTRTLLSMGEAIGQLQQLVRDDVSSRPPHAELFVVDNEAGESPQVISGKR